MRLLLSVCLLAVVSPAPAATPFERFGRIRVAESGTHLEHADGTPFFFLADTCWTGPALSSAADWQVYLADRKAKGFTAVQFNMVSPWRCAPTDADGNASYSVELGRLVPNEAFYKRLDARLKAVNDAGLLAVPVLCWAHKKGDAGKELTEEQITELVRFEVNRYRDSHVLWILAGDNNYRGPEAEMWKRIGRAAFGAGHPNPVTTHPTGENFPWKDWENERWLTVLGYQSGHGDSDKTMKWLTAGPPAEYGKRATFTRPVINLEPPYEGHNGYTHKKPHTDYTTRRAVYWSLLVHPPAGVTYGGHGVWSWHDRPGKGPIDHESSGVAKVWREALDLPGAAQMGHVRKLFQSLPWMKLRPAPDLIEQRHPDDAGKFVACATTPDNAATVVYFPAGATAGIRLHVSDTKTVRWFDPRTGEWGAPADAKFPNGPLNPPDARDWVMVVQP